MKANGRRIAILTALLTLAAQTAPVHAAEIIVDEGCSLAAAINAANLDRDFGGCPAGDGADVISLSRDVELDNFLSPIVADVTIEGKGHSITGTGLLRIFHIIGAELALKDVALTNASDSAGGAILNDQGTLSVYGSRIIGNSAKESGGAIVNNGGTVLINDSEISDNHSQAAAGAIHSRGGKLSILNSRIERNRSRQGGGAILVEGSAAVVLLSNTISDNQDEGVWSIGGAIWARGGSINIVDVAFQRNSAHTGMALAAEGGTVQIMGGSSFEDHESDGYGTVSMDGGRLTVSESAFRNNHAGGGGGALESEGGKLSIDKSEFRGNFGGFGGAIYVKDSGEWTISNSDFAENAAHIGGAISTESGALRIDDSRFDGNEGSLAGGAVRSENGDLTVSDSSFSRNASDLGGAINFDEGELTIYGSDFRYNAGEYGGALSLKAAEAFISFSEFAQNSADSGGAMVVHGRSLTIHHSKLSRNSAGTIAGAIWAEGGALTITQSSISDNTGAVGGGIRTDGAALDIRNSTLSGNRAEVLGAGALDLRGPGKATLTHVSILNNAGPQRGGIHHGQGADAHLRNSVIAGSEGGDCSGRLTVVIGSLIEDGSCLGNLSGDPMLAGPVEPEHGSSVYYPPLPGSPLIDAAESAYCSGADQIGTRRPQGIACDIGAIERR